MRYENTDLETAMRAAGRAIELDSDDALAHFALGLAATFQSLKQIGSTESHQSLSRAGKIIKDYSLCTSRRGMGFRRFIVAKTVSRKFQTIDCIDHVIGKKFCLLTLDLEPYCFWHTCRKVGPRAIIKS